MNLPNRLTVMRVCLIPVFLILYSWEAFGTAGRYAALVVFILASVTDALDGYIARSRGLITNFGKFMDPLADKLLVIAALTAMVEKGLLPAWVDVIIISRELLITGFRLLAAEQGVVIAADFWGKLKTVAQMMLIIYLLLGLTGDIWMIIANVLVVLVVVLTIASGLDYILKNRNVLIMEEKRK